MQSYHLLEGVVGAAVVDEEELPFVGGVLVCDPRHALLYQWERLLLVVSGEEDGYLFHCFLHIDI